MVNRFRLIVLLFLFFLFNANAAISLTPSYNEYKFAFYGKEGSWERDLNLACSGVIGAAKSEGYAIYTVTAAEVRGYSCYLTIVYRTSNESESHYQLVNPIYRLVEASCPSNSFPSGSACTCNEGYEEKNGNSCELPKQPDSCEALKEKCETLAGASTFISDFPMIKAQFVQAKPFSVCSPAGLVPGCSKGCTIKSSGLGGLAITQDGRTLFNGEGTYSSDTCTPAPFGNGEPPKEEDNPLPPSQPDEKPCKPGEFQGTVNGTKVCLPPKSKETVVKQETIENSDGSKTEVNTTVKCEGGKCTITETVTHKDSTGATTGTANKDSVTSQSNFCAQNPGSDVCKSGNPDGEDGEDEKSTFTGSCASNFTCEGDSVQCAIALEQHKTSCKLFDESNPYWQSFKDAEAGNSTGVESDSVDLASHLTVDSVIGAGACPADIEVTVFNQVIPFELSKFCRYFDAMGMLIVLGASVGCLRILGSG